MEPMYRSEYRSFCRLVQRTNSDVGRFQISELPALTEMISFGLAGIAFKKKQQENKIKRKLVG